MSDKQIARLNEIGFVWDFQKRKAEETWMNWYQELEKYTREHGNPNVPRTHSNTKLASWVWIQRQRRRGTHREGQLSQEKIQLLDKLGFYWDAREESWMEKFGELREFQIKHGHCEAGLDESDNSELAGWVAQQRAKLLNGQLSTERKALLDSMGFTWNSNLQDRKWQEMYERLKQYHADYGNADVPNRWKEDLKLANWVSAQRDRRKKGTLLSEERIRLLDELDFTWKSRDVGTWEDRLEDLAKFKAKHGHCDVPFEYPEIPKLGQFVNNMRSQRRSGKLSADRIAKLEALGFVWLSSRRRIGEDGISMAWKSRFDELVNYKQTHGNCEVPSDWKENAALARWVSVQRGLKKSGELHPERVKLLEEIGFTWALAGPKQPWEVRYAELLEFKAIHRDCDVPTNYVDNSALGKWVSKQRQNKKADKLSSEQVRLLDQIGFVWEKNPS